VPILLTILGIGLLIAIHELGHLIAAKIIGAPVKTFSIGFGKALFSWKSRNGQVTYRIGMIPLGGYVELEGEHRAGAVEPENFSKLAIWKRTLFYGGGIGANLAFAFLLIWGVTAHLDRRVNAGEGVIVMKALGPGSVAGVQKGDRLMRVNGIVLTNDLYASHRTLKAAAKHALKTGEPIMLEGTRGLERMAWRLGRPDGGKAVIGVMIGVDPEQPLENGPLDLPRILRSGIFALDRMWRALGAMLGLMVGFFMNTQGGEGVGGPIGMVQQGASIVKSGVIQAMLGMAVISMNLAVFNLLPVPMLDGGHILFLAWEAVTRKPVPVLARTKLLMAGGILLMALMVTLFLVDVARIFAAGR